MSRGLGKTIGRFLLDQRNAFRRLFGRTGYNPGVAWRLHAETAELINVGLHRNITALNEEIERLRAVPRRPTYSQNNYTSAQQAQYYAQQQNAPQIAAYQNSLQQAHLNTQQQNLVESARFAPNLWPGIDASCIQQLGGGEYLIPVDQAEALGLVPQSRRSRGTASSTFNDTEPEDL